MPQHEPSICQIKGATVQQHICAKWAPLHLVRVYQSGVWEVEGGDEQANAFALDPFTIQVISHDPGHIVLASARPAMEREG